MCLGWAADALAQAGNGVAERCGVEEMKSDAVLRTSVSKLVGAQQHGRGCVCSLRLFLVFLENFLWYPGRVQNERGHACRDRRSTTFARRAGALAGSCSAW